jgi:membrane-bound lytic murein transglycosylase MltF
MLIVTVCGVNLTAQVDVIEDMLDRPVVTFTGDLEEMRERRVIRVLTTYNQTNFFLVAGKIHGFEYELLAKYEDHLNKNVSRKRIRTDMVFVPVQKDQLIPLLEAGYGDIAAAGLTITPERLQSSIAFTDPYLTNVEEIIVTSKNVDDVNAVGDLAGREVYVVKGSSYAEHLRELNRLAEHLNRRPIEIVELGDFMETEDLLEMTNAGVIDVMVADHHVAKLWSRVFEDIVLHDDIVINSGGELAWAVRKNNPVLLADINQFIKQNKKGTLLGNILFERYYEGSKWITNPLSPRMKEKTKALVAIFQEYGEQYDIDWLGLAALAYQESGFDQNLKSHRGAVGIMQITPGTASQVGFADISNVRDNIHAGTKYLDWIRTTYFQDPDISRQDRFNFTLAAYNAGPRRVARMRSEAKEMGLDPDKWFYNVERAALRDVGQETVQYVANITKYYLVFKLSMKMLEKESE